MKLQEVMVYLKSKGNEQTRKIYIKHGAPKGFYGVKVADLKPLPPTGHETTIGRPNPPK